MDDIRYRKILAGEGAQLALAKDKDTQAESDALINEVVALDSEIARALDINVPDDLEQSLLSLPDAAIEVPATTVKTPSSVKFNKPLITALAASVILSVSFLLLKGPATTPFIQQALAHSHHQYRSVVPLSLNQVNAELALQRVTLSQDIGKIYFAKRCVIDDIETTHIVMIENGRPVSIYLMPENSQSEPISTRQKSQYIESLISENRTAYVVGPDRALVNDVRRRLDLGLDRI